MLKLGRLSTAVFFLTAALCRCTVVVPGSPANQAKADSIESTRIALPTPTCRLEVVSVTGNRASLRATVQGDSTSLLINGIPASPNQVVEVTLEGQNRQVTAEVFGDSGRNTCTVDVANPGQVSPSCTITASRNRINAGESVTLNWTIAGELTALSLNGNSRPIAQRSSDEQPPETTTYQLRVENNSNSGTCSVNVEVDAVTPPPEEEDPLIESFTVNNAPQLAGPVSPMTSLEFRWVARNVEACTLFKDSTAVANGGATGSYIAVATGDATYRITCSRGNLNASKSIAVAIRPIPGINSLTVNGSAASPLEVTRSLKARIEWTAREVDTCALSPFNRTGLTGSVEEEITADTEVVLQCRVGDEVLERKILLKAVTRPIVVERFRIAPGETREVALIAGSEETATLEWKILNAQTCDLEMSDVPSFVPRTVPAEGSYLLRGVDFTQNGSGMLTCSGGGGITYQPFRVHVLSARPTISKIKIIAYSSGAELNPAEIPVGEMIGFSVDYAPQQPGYTRCEISSPNHVLTLNHTPADRAFEVRATCGHVSRTDWDTKSIQIVPEGFTSLPPDQAGISYFKFRNLRPTDGVYRLDYNQANEVEFSAQNVDYCSLNTIYGGRVVFSSTHPAGRQVVRVIPHSGTLQLICFKDALSFVRESSVVFEHDPAYFPSGSLRVNGVDVVSVVEGIPTRVPANFDGPADVTWNLTGPLSDSCNLKLDYGAWTAQDVYTTSSGSRATKKIWHDVIGKLNCGGRFVRGFVIYPADKQIISVAVTPPRFGQYQIGDKLKINWSSPYYKVCGALISDSEGNSWVMANPGEREWEVSSSRFGIGVSCRQPTPALVALGAPAGFDASYDALHSALGDEVIVKAAIVDPESEGYTGTLPLAGDLFWAYPLGYRPRLAWLVTGGTCDITGGGLNILGTVQGETTAPPLTGPVTFDLLCKNTQETQTKRFAFEIIVDRDFPNRGSVRTMSKTGMPSGRGANEAVWTGTEMYVYGGIEDAEPDPYSYSYAVDRKQALGTGGRFNPSAGANGTWQSMAPARMGYSNSATIGSSVHWTGSRLIVWGGYSATATNLWVTAGKDTPGNAQGKMYNPATNAWTDLPYAPVAGRYGHASVWTGTEMVVFGGYRIVSHEDRGRGTGWLKYPKTVEALNDLAAYNPSTNQWRVLANPEPWKEYGEGIIDITWIFLAFDNGSRPPAVFFNGRMYVCFNGKLRYYEMSTGRWGTVSLAAKYGAPVSIHIVDNELMIYLSTTYGNTLEAAGFLEPNSGAVRYQKFTRSTLSERSTHPSGAGSYHIGYTRDHFILGSYESAGPELIERQTGLRYAMPKTTFAVTFSKPHCYGTGFGASIFTGENAPASLKNKILRTGGISSGDNECLGRNPNSPTDERQIQHTEMFTVP